MGLHPVLLAKMRKYVAIEKQLISLAAVTGLPFDEIKERMKGHDAATIRIVYMAACMDGKLMEPRAAAKFVEARRVAARMTDSPLWRVPDFGDVI